MARIVVPPKVSTQISGGTANDLIISNGGSSQLSINTSDPSVAGAAVILGPKDSVVMAAGSAWAAATWFAWTELGGEAISTEV